MKLFWQFALCCFFSSFQNLSAHGDLHDRIIRLTVDILNHPDSIELFQKRGELYLQHEDFSEAIKDFEFAIENNVSIERIFFNLATAHFKSNNLDASTKYVKHVLTKNASHVGALNLKGAIHLTEKRYKKAAICFENVIQFSSSPIPDNYLDASNAWQKTNTKNGKRKAVESIEKGITMFGDLVAFHNNLARLHESEEEWGRVIAHQTKIIDLSNRKEWGLVDRANVYIKMGHSSKAKHDLLTAQKLLSGRPLRIKSIPASVHLAVEIEHSITKLEGE